MAKKKDKTITPDSPHGDHVELSVEVLSQAIERLKPVIYKRANRKDYASYHFHAEAGGNLTIGAINAQMSMLIRVPVMSQVGSGTVMIDAVALMAMLGAYHEPRVRIHLGGVDQFVVFEGLRSKLKLPAYDPSRDLLVPAPACMATSGWTFEARHLAGALGRVRPFVDEESQRYALGGALFDLPEDGAAGPASIVCTDGRRLARSIIAATPLGQPIRTHRPPKDREGRPSGLPIVPAKALAIVEKLARGEAAGRIALAVMEADPIDLERNEYHQGKVQFITRDVVLTVLSLDGRFPLYEDVFPEDAPKALATIGRAGALADQLGVAVAACDSEHKGVEVTLAGGTIMLMSESDTKGATQLSLTDLPMSGKDTLTVDALFFRQMLDVLGDRPVQVETHGATKPLVCRSGTDWVGVLMPLTSSDDAPPQAGDPVPDSPSEPASYDGDEGQDHRDDGTPTVPEPEPGPIPEAVEPEAHKANGVAKHGRRKK